MQPNKQFLSNFSVARDTGTVNWVMKHNHRPIKNYTVLKTLNKLTEIRRKQVKTVKPIKTVEMESEDRSTWTECAWDRSLHGEGRRRWWARRARPGPPTLSAHSPQRIRPIRLAGHSPMPACLRRSKAPSVSPPSPSPNVASSSSNSPSDGTTIWTSPTPKPSPTLRNSCSDAALKRNTDYSSDTLLSLSTPCPWSENPQRSNLNPQTL